MNSLEQMRPGPVWRLARIDDVPAIGVIEHAVHTLGPERPEVIAEKIGLFGAGCRVLELENLIVGYGLSHPWRLHDAPALNSFLGRLPDDPDCLFLHDVALLPQVRAHGAGGDYVRQVAALARSSGLSRLALVSVYGTHHVWARCGFVVTKLEGGEDKLAGYGDTARYMVAKLTDE